MRHSALIHPAVRAVIRRIEHDLIGGAADMAREVAEALASAARESDAESSEAFAEEMTTALAAILRVTPSIAPVTRVLHLVGQTLEAPGQGDLASQRERTTQVALGFITWLEQALGRVAAAGAALLADGDVIFTYSISSTVFRMIERARSEGKRVRLVTTESRPGNEGLTTIPRMVAAGVPVTIGIDAAMAQLMRGCTWAVVGADTVTAGGSALCKVGSFPAALVARHYGIPFRVAADTSKFDPGTRWGEPLQIREMPASDILKELPAGVSGAPDRQVTVRNPVFEVVPASLITEIITEEGIFHPGAAAALMRDLPLSQIVAALRGLSPPPGQRISS
jgi:ribose 1,5-bisphosphate isomerase